MKTRNARHFGGPSTLVTFVEPGEARDSRPIDPVTSEADFQRRLRRAVKRDVDLRDVAPTVNPALDYQALCRKYAADLENGRMIQNRLFGKEGN